MQEGLSDNKGYALFQDSRGLLWIGTSNGLNYFDGVSFQNIYPTDFDSAHLHSNQIKQIAENADGNIVLMTDDGVLEYNWKEKTFRLIFPASMNGHTYQFTIDKQKNIWLLSEKYLQKYNPKLVLLKSITLDTLKDKIKNDGGFNVTFCSIDNANNVWFSYHDLLCKWNASKDILESKYNNIYRKRIFDFNTASITQDEAGYYWFILNYKNPPNALACYNWNTDSFQVYHTKSNLTIPLVISSSKKIWINSYYNGLVIFDKIQHTFETIYSTPGNINTPSENVLDVIYEDRSGNIWLGAPNNGLNKCTDLSNKFTVLNKFGYEDMQSHFKAFVDGVAAYKKDLFICTTGGFFKINTGNFYQQCFKYDEKKSSPEDYYWISLNIDNASLLASTLKGIWIYKLNDEKLKPAPFPFRHPALLDSAATVAAFKDHNKNIWLGMFGGSGVYCWHKQKNIFIKYDQQQTGKYYFPLRHFSCAAEDDKGNIWMGYDKGGLTIFDNALQKFIQPKFAAFKLLKNNIIHDIVSDHQNNLWISTSEGIFRYSTKTQQLKQYSRTNGLISNIVMGMAFDKKGILWMGTYSGLSRFDTSTKTFINFTTADGLPAEEIDRVIYDSAINKICCTTEYSVVLFNPYHLVKNIPALNPVITSFFVTGNQRRLNNSGKVNLSSKENFFSFNYTAANFINTADVRYEYKLDGFNKNWVDAGNRQYVAYTNLDGGNYVFKLRATDDNGVHWYQMSAPVTIHINTPFFKTVWFYLLMCAVIIGIIFLFIYSAYRSKLKRMVTALKIRNEIASDLHDDIGSSLSSIMLMSELAKKQQAPAEDYFNKIKENAGKIIENMNDIVWAVNPNNDTVEQLLIRMQSFASSLLEKKNIALQFKTCAALPLIKLSMTERKNFYLIFKEAIHNAFKYAVCNNVTVEINKSAKTICMMIKDDGKGFDAAKNYTGNGLCNIKKRSKELNGRLDIISNCGEGTFVTLNFAPTQKSS